VIVEFIDGGDDVGCNRSKMDDLSTFEDFLNNNLSPLL
jgi:hypothetical protein